MKRRAFLTVALTGAASGCLGSGNEQLSAAAMAAPNETHPRTNPHQVALDRARDRRRDRAQDRARGSVDWLTSHRDFLGASLNSA
ncbi:MAG: hypothetical protein HN899_12180 [Gemmatimonadales bacterium]|jgi:hypothetical protein|nr:hypothetical protein [Gemmatimonadales bacterium]MBT6697200.1 hypothetical protein [Gemmatimonadales bacterium]MBT7125912.1 hypothetical protein [Gemmatimonadales bacterium]MBT7690513.1 hypothetical protein [Gemmatimonadales bacterium]